MRTPELNVGEPMLHLLAPPGADTAGVEQPCKSAFDHPAPGRVALNVMTRSGKWFVAPAAMVNVRYGVGHVDDREQVGIILALVRTQVLPLAGTGHHDGHTAICHRPLVTLMGAG